MIFIRRASAEKVITHHGNKEQMRDIGIEFGRFVIVEKVKGYQKCSDHTVVPVKEAAGKFVNIDESDRNADLTQEKYRPIREAENTAEIIEHISGHRRMLGIAGVESTSPHQRFCRVKVQCAVIS